MQPSSSRGPRHGAASATALALLWTSACGNDASPAGNGATSGGADAAVAGDGGTVDTGAADTKPPPAGACETTSDCAAFEDGNLCNGTWACTAGQCRLDPTTIQTCDSIAATTCMVGACDPATGACKATPRHEGLGCDDGEPCTLGDLCVGGSCQAGDKNFCACTGDKDCPDDDANPCTGTRFCNTSVFPYRCEVAAATIVTCPDAGLPCKANVCDPKTGTCQSQELASTTTCDDGDPCTANDHCQAGACAGGTDTCSCSQDGDCADVDGDPCTGTPYCDKSGGKGVCKPNPATVIVCATAADTDCRKNTCDKALGACKLVPVADKAPCDDGDACTKGEICVAGSCAAGTDVCKCSSDADCKDSDDGNLCNGLPYCNKQSGKCETNPATVVICPTVDDSACAKNVCLPKTGACSVQARAAVNIAGCQAADLGGGVVVQFCLYVAAEDGKSKDDPASFVCEDGNACSKGDVCDGKACKPGAAVCECSGDADCTGKDDGNLCNGTMFCNKQTGKCEINPASVVSCPSVDDTACLKNTCNPKTGGCLPQAVPAESPCDDGNACTKGDLCKLGQCQPGTFACACQHDGDCAAKEDGDLCNGTLFCDKSGKEPACKLNPKSVVSCPSVDDTACVKNTCNPKTGVCLPQPAPAQTACDDGNPCTKGDLCKLGQCQPGTFACECQSDGDCAAKDDGDLCNGTMFCDKSGAAPACKPLPGSAVFCPSANDSTCLKNTCDAKTAKCSLQPVKAGTPCDDDQVCTVNEACDQGACGGGKANPCDDKDPCTTDGCDKKAGCAHAAKSCSDGNDCTQEACDAKTGNCSAPKPVAKGGLCNGDDKGCTVGDACDGAGACQVGGAVACKQPSDPCKEAVCNDKGGTDYLCAEATRADGSSCDDGVACKIGAACKAGVCSAPTLDTLYLDVAIGDSAGWTELRDVAASEGTDLLLAGRRRDKQSDPSTKNVGFVRRVDVRGSTLWERPFGGDGEHAENKVAAMTATTGGGALALGEVWVKDINALQTRLWQVAPGGGAMTWMWVPTTLTGFKAPVPLDLDSHVGGSHAVLLRDDKTCGQTTCSTLRVVVVSAAGAQTASWSRPLDTAQLEAVPFAQLEFRDDERLFVSGTRSWLPNGQSQRSFAGLMLTLSAAGSVITDAKPGKEGVNGFTAAWGIAATDAWSVQLGSVPLDSNKSAEWAVGTTLAQGEDERVYAHKRNFHPQRWSVGGDGLIAVAGTALDKANADVIVGAIDRRGNLHWSQRLDGGSVDTLAGVAVSAGKHIAVATNVVSGGASRGRLTRLSVFGHGSCALAGVCAGKAWSACQDGKICTVDGCNGAVGCQHAVTNGVACDVSNGCSVAAFCDSGACQQTSFGDIRWLDGGPFTKDDVIMGPYAMPATKVADEFAFYDAFAGQNAIERQVTSPDMVEIHGDFLGFLAPGGGGMPTIDENLRVAMPEPGESDPMKDVLLWGNDRAGPGNKNKAVFVRRGGQSWTFSTCDANDAKCESRAVKMVVGATGATWALSNRISNGTSFYADMHRLDKNGVPAGSTGAPFYAFALGGPTEAILDADARPDGGVVVALERTGSSKYATVIARAFDAGVGIYQKDLKPSGDLIASAIRSTSLGGAALAGTLIDQKSGLRRGYLALLDAKGSVSWESYAPQPDGRQLSSVLPLADRILVGGVAMSGPYAAILGAWDYAGVAQWERNFGATNTKRIATGLAERSDGGIVFAYLHRVTGNTADRAKIIRTNAWGHTDCVSAGTCGAKGLVDCDDGNPCTIDLCDAKGGCSSAKTDGGVCGTGKVCSAGACVVAK